MTMQEVSTTQGFISLVAKMRSLQQEYFKSRDRSTLDQCKFLEREVDRAILEFTAPSKQTSLF